MKISVISSLTKAVVFYMDQITSCGPSFWEQMTSWILLLLT